MEILPFGNNTPPESVSAEDWKRHLHGLGGVTAIIQRLDATSFKLRLTSEMQHRILTFEEMEPMLRGLALNTGWHPAISGNLSLPVRRLPPKVAPRLTPDQLNDLLKGL